MELFILKSRRWLYVFGLFILSQFSLNAQVAVNSSVLVSLNSFSSVNDAESVFSDHWRGDFIQTQVITPAVGVELEFPDYHIGVRGSFYIAPISSPYGELIYYPLLDYKSARSFDVDYRWEKLRIGLVWSQRFYSRASIEPLGSANQNGIGFKVGWKYGKIDFELRDEMFILFERVQGHLSPTLFGPAFGISLRATYPIRIYSNQVSVEKSPNESETIRNGHGLNFQFGALITGNPNFGFIDKTEPLNTGYALGLEYFHQPWNVALLFRRTQSIRLGITGGIFQEYIQNNYFGVSYWMPLDNNKYVKFDLLHNWSFNRATQTGINQEAFMNNESLPFQMGDYPNLSVGLACRYPISRSVDAFGQLDIYYKADEYSKTGFARNSISLGMYVYLFALN
ncbi:hypothetical protein [Phaeocystidibacter marisrubri]|uniref:Uncharacterized protein n=1 Tax=Phaeocystidibacter marisrubri TaxID=1577780 RepID=A0A6L3ZJD5_9FLAO|nr:hypothetical protein [Phaeocystidibacter marisrubri]KAB2818126.1 hypothetical protein F8C82_06905 [Phaeocystidibacter marisrubri]GGH71825.1 hypothetical protein GCM10011318_15170 [Phaeocystidibacter marisrubri]